MTSYPWPTLPSSSQAPIWTGHSFQIEGIDLPILSYEIGTSGWTDDLTSFHEETAGANHFIDVASRHHAMQQIEAHNTIEAPIILEIGCSSGFTLRMLRDRMTNAFIIGSDYIRGPLEQLATELPSVPLLQFDLVNCPLPDNSIDIVVLLNVLEHISDDVAAMGQINRILRPGGIVVIEVPAGEKLYDVYDKLLLHYRRYSLCMLRNLATSTGFRIVDQSHLGFFMYPGFWVVKQRNKKSLSETEAIHKKIAAQNIRSTQSNLLLKGLMRLELALGRWISYPVGIRCLLTCTKPF